MPTGKQQKNTNRTCNDLFFSLGFPDIVVLATVDWDPKFLNPKDPTSLVQRSIFAGDWRKGSLTPPKNRVLKCYGNYIAIDYDGVNFGI